MNRKSNIKVPSHFSSVTVPKIRKFIEVLDKLGEPFTKQDAQNIEELQLKSKGGRGRLISYLKYLGILKEERNKKQSERQYYLTDLGKELRETKQFSPSKFEDKWREVIIKSELYQAITENNEFKEKGYISREAFRELILDGFSKNVTYIKKRLDKSEKFLRQLLEDGHAFTFEGDYYRPIKYVNMELKGEESDYLLHIKEPNFELKIEDWDDLTLDFLNKYIEYKKSHNKTKNFEDRKK